MRQTLHFKMNLCIVVQMKIQGLKKAAIFAAIRLILTLLFGYIIVGCILFPQWWKEFALQGGFLKEVFWRDGFAYLGGEFASFSPLAATTVLTVLGLVMYSVYWLGKNANQSENRKTAFVERLAPSTFVVGVLAVILLIALVSAYRQPGSYSHQKARTRYDRLLDEMISKLGKPESYREFDSPSSGVYLYVNDKLILQQYESLRGDLEIKSVTESTATEKAASTSISLPLEVGSVDLSGKNTTEKTITRNAPEISSTFALQNLIRQFNKNTNTTKIRALSSFGESSDWIVNILKAKSVELSKDQVDQLKKSDRLSFQEATKDIHPREVLLIKGLASVKKVGEAFGLQIVHKGTASILVRGQLQKQFMRDHMLFSLDFEKDEAEFFDATMLSIVQQIERDASDNLILTVIPYAIW